VTQVPAANDMVSKSTPVTLTVMKLICP
jgi:hypothetical protein